MSPAPISRRSVVAGALADAALPSGVVAPVAVATASTGSAATLPVVFDPAVFVAEMHAAGHQVSLQQPVRVDFSAAEDLTPFCFIHPLKTEGYGLAYHAVMAKWVNAMDACPDHVERTLDYLCARVGRARV